MLLSLTTPTYTAFSAGKSRDAMFWESFISCTPLLGPFVLLSRATPCMWVGQHFHLRDELRRALESDRSGLDSHSGPDSRLRVLPTLFCTSRERPNTFPDLFGSDEESGVLKAKWNVLGFAGARGAPTCCRKTDVVRNGREGGVWGEGKARQPWSKLCVLTSFPPCKRGN